MYDVEKRSAVLEDAVRSRNKMAALGETNFAFPRTLYSSECHRRSFLRGSDTSARPRV